MERVASLRLLCWDHLTSWILLILSVSSLLLITVVHRIHLSLPTASTVFFSVESILFTKERKGGGRMIPVNSCVKWLMAMRSLNDIRTLLKPIISLFLATVMFFCSSTKPSWQNRGEIPDQLCCYAWIMLSESPEHCKKNDSVFESDGYMFEIA